MHSNELYLLLTGSALVAGLFGLLHARRYWEGLPPILDGLVSAGSYLAIIGAFVVGGRLGGEYGGHPHAGRVVAVMVALLGTRMVRTWLGKEQERYRSARSKVSATE